jgi:sarcosine oxidase
MSGRAGELWRQLEEESGTTILTTTGGLDFGPVRDPLRLHETLTACGVPAELVAPGEAAERWPGFRFGGPVLFHPEAGVLDPDRAMAAMLASAEADGADVRFGTPATELFVTAGPVRDGVTGAGVTGVSVTGGGGAVVRAGTEEFTAPVAVIAVGAWLESLMGGLVRLPPLTVTQEQILHLPQRSPDPARPWPSFIYEDGITCFYGLLGGRDGGIPGAVKIGEHHAGKPVTAAARDFAPDPACLERILGFARDWLPGLDVPAGDAVLTGDAVPADAGQDRGAAHDGAVNGAAGDSGTLREATCLYTTTVNEDFILDRQGPFVIASPCSGHGAKFAPLLGEIITDLAQGRPSPDARFTLEAARAAARNASAHRAHA